MPLSHAGGLSLDFIGQQIIPHDYRYEKTVVGGLSALDYNPDTGRFLAICDDRSKKNPARFYELQLDYDADGFHKWAITNVQFLKQPDGTNFPKPVFFGKSTVDPEALKLSPNRNSYFWTSEGHAKHGVKPFIREMDLYGRYLRDFTLPEKYHLIKDKTGPRDNQAFEALTINHDHTTITVATEGPLIQDGEAATAQKGAPVRFLHLDIKSGQPLHEYVYVVEPVHEETLPFGMTSISGVVDILSLGTHEYLVVERSFSAGSGLSVKLYLTDFTDATDVLAEDSLQNISYQPAKKHLLLDLGTLGIDIDNIEGMSFGKRLADGRRSLLLISDDNFRSAQTTQILLFAVNDRSAKIPH
ncbi:MAG: esterase-like activity of phytase family protein [Emcibacter sp.]|nr:esterase-like activity of phytase family protein [Emcibacter sp.]